MNVLIYDSFITNCIRKYHQSDSRDIKQDVYVAMLTHRLDEKKNIKAYIFTIVKSIVYSHLRKKNVRLTATKSIPKHILINEEIIPKVSKELMLHAQGYKYDEISKFMNVSARTLRDRVYRERKKLRSHV